MTTPQDPAAKVAEIRERHAKFFNDRETVPAQIAQKIGMAQVDIEWLLSELLALQSRLAGVEGVVEAAKDVVSRATLIPPTAIPVEAIEIANLECALITLAALSSLTPPQLSSLPAEELPTLEPVTRERDEWRDKSNGLERELAMAGVRGSPPPGGETLIGTLSRRAHDAEEATRIATRLKLKAQDELSASTARERKMMGTLRFYANKKRWEPNAGSSIRHVMVWQDKGTLAREMLDALSHPQSEQGKTGDEEAIVAELEPQWKLVVTAEQGIRDALVKRLEDIKQYLIGVAQYDHAAAIREAIKELAKLSLATNGFMIRVNGVMYVPASPAGEVERLREVVAKLPKTADGVPIAPGMKLWFKFTTGGIVSGQAWNRKNRIHAEYDEPIDLGGGNMTSDSDPDVRVIYSTRAAAESASSPSSTSVGSEAKANPQAETTDAEYARLKALTKEQLTEEVLDSPACEHPIVIEMLDRLDPGWEMRPSPGEVAIGPLVDALRARGINAQAIKPKDSSASTASSPPSAGTETEARK